MIMLPKWGASRGISPPHARLPHLYSNANVRLGGTPTFPAALVRGRSRRLEDRSRVFVVEHSSIRAFEHSSIRAFEHSSIRAFEHSSIRAFELLSKIDRSKVTPHYSGRRQRQRTRAAGNVGVPPRRTLESEYKWGSRAWGGDIPREAPHFGSTSIREGSGHPHEPPRRIRTSARASAKDLEPEPPRRIRTSARASAKDPDIRTTC